MPRMLRFPVLLVRIGPFYGLLLTGRGLWL